MSIIKWRESYNVNIDKIDKQHQKLIEILNNMYDAMSEGKSQEIMKNIIHELTEYTVYHFATEEGYMSVHHFPEYREHKKLHDEFVDKVKDFRTRFNSGENFLSIDLVKFLRDWLINHICEKDKKFGIYMKDKEPN
jgi:hemerythrin-like metal-binding protein